MIYVCILKRDDDYDDDDDEFCSNKLCLLLIFQSQVQLSNCVRFIRYLSLQLLLIRFIY